MARGETEIKVKRLAGEGKKCGPGFENKFKFGRPRNGPCALLDGDVGAGGLVRRLHHHPVGPLA